MWSDTKNPILCPRCQEDELWRPAGVGLRVRCGECGWDSGVLSEVPVLPSEAAALTKKAVEEHKANNPTQSRDKV